MIFLKKYCSHRSQSCLKHPGQGHSLTWSKVTQISKLNLFCRNSWAIWNQSSYESLWENEDENYTKELGHMTNMAAMPIYGTNLKNLLLQNQ